MLVGFLLEGEGPGCRPGFEYIVPQLARGLYHLPSHPFDFQQRSSVHAPTIGSWSRHLSEFSQVASPAAFL